MLGVFHYSSSQLAIRVPKGGFCWAETDFSGERLLKLQRKPSEPAESEGYRSYQPMTKPDLFRRFSQIDTSSPEKALGFADRYGELGVREFRWGLHLPGLSGVTNALWEPVFDPHFQPDPARPSDTWDLWHAAIGDMRRCLRLWESIASVRRSELQRKIRRKGLAQVLEEANIRISGLDTADVGYHFYDDGTDRARLDMPFIASELSDKRFLNGVGEVTPQALALYHIEKVANKYLRQFTKVEFEPTSEKYVSLAFVIAPDSLIGALWVQFAQYMSGVPGTDYRACKCGCGQVFSPTRHSHVFWEDDCRTRYNRRMRRQNRKSET